MNLFELQERLKDFSQDQLVREMQAPTGMAPQYLVLSELQRRQRMMAEQQAQMPEDQTTVAQDAVAAAGMPQGGLSDMAQAMAPRTDMDMNDAVQPVERMQEGGTVSSGNPEQLTSGVGRITDFIRSRGLDPSRFGGVAGQVFSMAPKQAATGGSNAFLEALETGRFKTGLGALVDRYNRGELDPEKLGGAARFQGMAAKMIADLSAGGSQNQQGTGQYMQPVFTPPPETYRPGVDPEWLYYRSVPRMADGGVVRMQPGGLAGISRDLDAYSPTMTGGDARRRMMEERDARRRRAELAALLIQQSPTALTGEGQLFQLDESPLLPREIGPSESAPPVGTDLRGLGTIVGEFISGEDPEAAATQLLESGQIDEEQYNRYVFGSSREREQVVREALDLAPRREFPVPADVTDEADVADEAAATPEVTPLPELVLDAEPRLSFGDQFPPVDVRRAGSEELSFGGIEPTGAPIPFTLPKTGLTRQDRETPPPGGGGAAAPAMDDSFEQDKWLALAQFGLNLMASKQPTFGGALGEAGLAGITALRTARSERDKRIEAQQARADRLAAAAARSERGDISSTERAAYFRAANEAEAEVARLELAIARGGEVGEGGFVMNPYTPEELAILERQLNAAKSRASVYSGLSNPALATIQAAL